MPNVLGGIEESVLQNVILSTVQDQLSQQDTSIRALSERFDAADARTKQGLDGFDERLELLSKREHQKVDQAYVQSAIGNVDLKIQTKIDGIEWKSSSAIEQVQALQRNIEQLARELERREAEGRAVAERLDDLNRRLQHKADSAYVDTRIRDLRTQLITKVENEDLNLKIDELSSTLGECRRLIGEKDLQMTFCMEQLAGTASFSSVDDKIQELAASLQSESQNQRADIAKHLSEARESLLREVKEVEERVQFVKASYIDDRMKLLNGVLEDRILSLEKSATNGELGPLDTTAICRAPVREYVSGSPRRTAAAVAMQTAVEQAPALTYPQTASEMQGVVSNVSRTTMLFSSASAQEAATVRVQPLPEYPALPEPIFSGAEPIYGGSAILARGAPEAAQVMQAAQRQPEQNTAMARSQSAPGLQRRPTAATPATSFASNSTPSKGGGSATLQITSPLSPNLNSMPVSVPANPFQHGAGRQQQPKLMNMTMTFGNAIGGKGGGQQQPQFRVR